ncbi:MAG: hypothetical protein ABEJ02_02460 [Candidatus Paceibacteria bacterium]
MSEGLSSPSEAKRGGIKFETPDDYLDEVLSGDESILEILDQHDDPEGFADQIYQHEEVAEETGFNKERLIEAIRRRARQEKEE